LIFSNLIISKIMLNLNEILFRFEFFQGFENYGIATSGPGSLQSWFSVATTWATDRLLFGKGKICTSCFEVGYPSTHT
jgi:hypothetical protein